MGISVPTVLRVGKREYEVEAEVVSKSTSSVRIRDGKVLLKLSRFSFGRQREEVVRKFLDWAVKKLEKVSETDFIDPSYTDGGRICTHNKIYELRIFFEDRSRTKSVLTDLGIIELYLPKGGEEVKKTVKQLVDRLIIKDQTQYLWDVLDELNQLYFQEDFNECRFKRISSRFGSCSSKRNINIAFRLLFAPREVFRYVCVHELAHLKEFNHSKRFWSLVAEAMPDYKVQEKWLKDSGFMLG